MNKNHLTFAKNYVSSYLGSLYSSEFFLKGTFTVCIHLLNFTENASDGGMVSCWL
jgi:hypothetical protein